MSQPSVSIAVRGSHSAFRPAERGTVHATVSLEGPDAERVYAAVVTATQQVTGSVAELHDPQRGPVTWWASKQVHTSSRRPRGKDGEELAPLHRAQVDLSVKFRDFDALAAWVQRSTAVKGFGVSRIEWALTEEHRLRLVHEVRAGAVRDARDKAQAYADALGLGPVRAVALADPGMLGDGVHGQGTPGEFTRSGGAQPASARLVPEDIEISAQLDARFATGG